MVSDVKAVTYSLDADEVLPLTGEESKDKTRTQTQATPEEKTISQTENFGQS